MKIGTILFILLLGSLSLALPIFSPTKEIQLLPNSIQQILIQQSTPTLEIHSIDDRIFNMNVSLIDGTARHKISTQNDISQVKLNDLEAGFYEISLLSKEVVDIVIDPQGLNIEAIIIIGFLAFVNIVNQVRKYYLYS